MEAPITSFDGLYRFLSNFYSCNILMDGKIYPSVEHAYQAAKTWDLEARELIRNAKNAAIAKKLGRSVSIRPGWNQIRVDVMRTLIEKKFRNLGLRALLIMTGHRELIEGNYWNDRFWGQCPIGVGENWLGKILMEERAKHL